MRKPSQVHHFVFVHGASHGAWCWYKVRTLLEAAGQKGTCIDLAGAGINSADPNTVFTMEQYNQPLFDFLSTLPDDEKVILVGHSVGGATVTDAMCMFTNKISMAVYVAASMEKPKQVTLKHKIVGISGADDIFDFIYGLGTDEEPTGLIMKKQYQRDKYYNQSPLEDSTLASMLLRPAPYRALRGSEEWPVVPQEIEGVPRMYVKTMNDHMFDLRRQDLMVAMWPPNEVYCLESDHSAFFSNPTGLFDCLIRAAASLN